MTEKNETNIIKSNDSLEATNLSSLYHYELKHWIATTSQMKPWQKNHSYEMIKFSITSYYQFDHKRPFQLYK